MATRIADEHGVDLSWARAQELPRSLPGWPVFPDVPAALEDARRRGWRLCILSNTDRALLDASLESIGVPFDHSIVAEEVGSYKPAHGHWERFYADTGAERSRHVHVAQSLFHDIAVANELGLASVWINRLGEQAHAVAPAHEGAARAHGPRRDAGRAGGAVNVRRPGSGDLGAVVELLRTVEVADTGEAEWDERQLRDHWGTIELERDAWLVELDGRLAGYADLEVRPGGRIMADGYVHPELRGRGVGSELLRLTEDEARARMGSVGRAVSTCRTRRPRRPTTSTAAAATRRCAGSGAWSSSSSRRPTRSLRPASTCVRCGPGRSRPSTSCSRRRSPGTGSTGAAPSTSMRSARSRATTTTRPSAPWPRRTASSRGASLNWWKDSDDWGWIGTIGVPARFRGRGIGEALMRWTFAEFLRRGERRVALGVDAQNETGATRLYERLGMRTLWEAAVWEKELRGS